MVPGKKKSPKKAFSIEGMTGKFTEESWTIFKFYRLIPSDDPTHTERYLMLTPRFHKHETMHGEKFPREILLQVR